MKLLKSHLFEAFTHSKIVEQNYQLFWIVYLGFIWFIPDAVLVLDPYALSIIPLITILEIGFNILNVTIESQAFFLSRGILGKESRLLSLFYSLFMFPFLVSGLFLIYNSGSYFTTAVYFWMWLNTIHFHFKNKDSSPPALIERITDPIINLFIFLFSTGFVMIPWPEFGLQDKLMNIPGKGLLVENPYRGIPAGIIAFLLCWLFKRYKIIKKFNAFLSPFGY
ncbi:MAG: hypothetical protein K9K67_14940 [Bacteriovoracaceae bacterium]|nr:hypothetical protein [Bacteriovoracaceae bacterium]